MKYSSIHFLIASVFLAVGAFAGIASAQAPVGSAFTYQGRLKINGVLHNGTADFCFSLFDAQLGGSLIGNQAINNIAVTKGLFSVELNFGASAFNGEKRWLEIKVRTPGNSGAQNCASAYSTLAGRQSITPAPYSVHAIRPWQTLDDFSGDISYNNGFVGISSSDPQRTLQIGEGNVAFPGIIRMASANGAGVVLWDVGIQTVGDPGPGDFVVQKLGAAPGLVVAATGNNVGIGTSNPQAGLEVANNNGFRLSGPSGNLFDIDSNGRITIKNGPETWSIEATGGFITFRDNGSVERVRFNALANPALEVTGTACVTGGFNCPSDIQLKSDVATVENGLASIGKLRGVHFNWRVDEFPDRGFDDRRQIGFIAQEIQDVIPELVTPMSDGLLSVDYGRLTPVLVEAVKELHGIVKEKDAQLTTQQAMNQQQQSTIEHQQSQIVALTARLAIIERMLSDKETLP